MRKILTICYIRQIYLIDNWKLRKLICWTIIMPKDFAFWPFILRKLCLVFKHTVPRGDLVRSIMCLYFWGVGLLCLPFSLSVNSWGCWVFLFSIACSCTYQIIISLKTYRFPIRHLKVNHKSLIKQSISVNMLFLNV